MKQLQRQASPNCLNNLIGGLDRWRDVNKSEVWLALDIMQKNFCAYCECILKNKHIEHFRTRDRYSQYTFDWNNLFGSCGDPTKVGQPPRCGIYKDRCGHPNPDHLIKPDIDNPSDFLDFLRNGTVRPKTHLSVTDNHKAEETIRVFNLNGDSGLVNRRKRAIEVQLYEIEQLHKIKSESDDELWKELLQDEIAQLKNVEFSTALIQAWHLNE